MLFRDLNRVNVFDLLLQRPGSTARSAACISGCGPKVRPSPLAFYPFIDSLRGVLAIFSRDMPYGRCVWSSRTP